MAKLKNKKTNRKRKHKMIVTFRVDDYMLKVLEHLRHFYQMSTRNKLFPGLVATGVLQVANTTKHPAWAPEQVEAWEYCRAIGDELAQEIVLQIVKAAHGKRREPDRKLSMAKIFDLAKTELVKEMGPACASRFVTEESVKAAILKQLSNRG